MLTVISFNASSNEGYNYGATNCSNFLFYYDVEKGEGIHFGYLIYAQGIIDTLNILSKEGTLKTDKKQYIPPAYANTLEKQIVGYCRGNPFKNYSHVITRMWFNNLN